MACFERVVVILRLQMSQPAISRRRSALLAGSMLLVTSVASLVILVLWKSLDSGGGLFFTGALAVILGATLLQFFILSRFSILRLRLIEIPDYESEIMVQESIENYNTFSVDLKFHYLHFSGKHAKDVRKFFHQKPKKGQNFFDIIPPKLSTDLRSSFQEAMAGKYITLRRKFGTDYFQLVLNPMYDMSSKVMGLTCHFEDITTKIEMERQLEAYHENLEEAIELRAGEVQEQRDFFQKVIDAIANLIFVRDDRGRYVLVNKSAADSFPEKLGSVIGKTTLDTHHNPHQAKRFMLEDKEILLTGKKIVSESIYEGSDGVEKFLYLTKTLLDVKGKKYVLGVHTDITELKRQEQALIRSNKELQEAVEKLKKAQDSLVESEKLASLGQLTAGLAHEINNPINYVSGNISPLLEDFKDVNLILRKVLELKSALENSKEGSELLDLMQELEVEELIGEIRKLLEGIADGTSRVKELMHSLKNLSRRNENTLIKIHINKIILSTLALIKPSVSDRIKIISDLGEVPVTMGSPGEISQVLLNVIDNAIFAMEGSGELCVKSSQSGDQILVEIKDSGWGISEENLRRIFEPFYTTKEVGEGTGLGLAISHQIINKHQGQIHVESERKKGTTFQIFLPIRSN